MRVGQFNIVIGGQAGSESKGKLAAHLVHESCPLLHYVSMTASPNAGHTYVDDTGRKHVSYHLPISGVVLARHYGGKIVLGPASLINVLTLVKEMQTLGIKEEQVIIDPRASIILDRHLRQERFGSLSNIGSTLQGVGAARCAKMSRGHKGPVEFAKDNVVLREMGIPTRDTEQLLNDHMSRGGTVLHEMTQGFDLDLEHGISPLHCTSKMINPMMAMAEMGIPAHRLGDVYGVIRPYPIRVNNRTGYSGSYDDAEEITWAEVGARAGAPGDIVAELTTTTKLPRRVFEFSENRFKKFVRVCKPTVLCLQFANYIDWSVHGESNIHVLHKSQAVMSFIEYLEEIGGVHVKYIGTGPANSEMVVRHGCGMMNQNSPPHPCG